MPRRAVILCDFDWFFAIYASRGADHVRPNGSVQEGPLIGINSGRNVGGEEQGVVGMLFQKIAGGFALARAQATPAQFSRDFVASVIPGKNRQGKEKASQ